ncbi:ATP-binding protein [Actinoplanes sp. CA-030573]|uniref:ATP-binding protein n=1 Tax=Actinoplanes sp. CA-030573 TaxID=3239898 RepID=UPI003D8E1D2C
MSTVVVAEDNADHQRVIAEVVRRLGHQPILADDGLEALAAVRAHRPVLLLADIDMPRMSGLELCARLREDPDIAGIPVILITAYLLPGDPRLSASGAIGVIGKPFSVPALLNVLRGHLAALGAPADPQAMLDAVLDCVDTGVIVFDAGGRLLTANRGMRDALGADEPGAPLSAVGHRQGTRQADGTPLPEERWPVSLALRGEKVDHVELMADDPQGRPHWLTVNARPVRNADGVVVAAVGAAHDVTVAHRTRQYQHCKSEVLKALATDPDGPDAGDRILRAIGTTLGWPYLRLWLVDEPAGLLRPAAIYTEPDEPGLPLPSSIAPGEGLAGRCWETGELVWVPDLRSADSPILPQVAEAASYRSAGAVPVRSSDRVIGTVTFFSCARQETDPVLGMLLTGIAAVIGAVLEHRRAETLARHLEVATDEYMELAGHELRTPLTSIGSYIDLIAESPDDTPLGDVRDLFDVVHRNSTRLRGLVDKLLDLAGLESGHLPLASEPVDLAAVVGEAVAEAPAERGITVDLARLDPVTVPGDRERLRQVVDALLSNAIKFSPPDATVTVTLVDEERVAALTVADAGIGISAAGQSRLFRRLRRGDNARHSGIPGAGLGLALCRVVVERHRGSITLSSHEATGTTVTVRLPQ